MNILAALALLLAPLFAWADMGEAAERAAERILMEENVLNVYLASNDDSRVTLVFGRQIADWQISAVLRRLNTETAIRGVNYSRADTDYCPIR